jgi:hypothetical protein
MYCEEKEKPVNIFKLLQHLHDIPSLHYHKRNLMTIGMYIKQVIISQFREFPGLCGVDNRNILDPARK